MILNPLKPSDYQRLAGFFEKQEYRLCVYSLSSLIVWINKIYQPCWTVIGDDTLIAGVEYNAVHADKRYLFLPISPDREYSPEELHEVAMKSGFQTYGFVPDEYIEKYGRARVENFFEISEQPDLHDYVYLREDLATLKGNRYAKKRNLINQFTREFADKRIQVEKITSSVVPDCADFLEKWCEERKCEEDPEGLSCEKQAVLNSFEHIDHLGMRGILLRIDGVVTALGIGSRVTGDMSALHFEKAFAGIKGLYQFFDRLCAQQLFEDCIYINKESDMGNPGLAKAKKSYHPIMILKSYKLRLRGTDWRTATVP